MGLDMYLNAERYLWSHHDGDKQLSENIGQLVGLPADGRIKTITEIIKVSLVIILTTKEESFPSRKYHMCMFRLIYSLLT